MAALANTTDDPAAIRYSEFPGCGRRFFRCAAYSATLSVEACAGRFRRAQAAPENEIFPVQHCRACAIGAKHAGVDVPVYSNWYRALICPRCGSGTTRMIGARICVSCYNRSRELRAGRNSKGTAPVNLKPLFSVRLHCLVDGAPTVLKTVAIDTTEAMAAVMQTVSGRIYFTRGGPGFANAPVQSLDRIAAARREAEMDRAGRMRRAA